MSFLLLLLLVHLTEAWQRCPLDSIETHRARIAFQVASDQMNEATVAEEEEDRYYELRVVFHVIRDSQGIEGHVPLDSIQANVDSSNRVLSGEANTRGRGVDSRLRLLLAGVTYTNHSDWFYGCSDPNIAGDLKMATAISVATMVNVWTCHSETLLGWVHFLPYEVSPFSPWNGVNVNYKSLPVSKVDEGYENLADYAEGDTFTHEFGHYLGLLHTFGDGVNGCTRGDAVEDTPAEASPAIGKACRLTPPRDTCPDQPGVDPVFNIMDYTDDSCAEELTAGQVRVMRRNLERYRSILIALEPARCVTDGIRGTAGPMTLCKSDCLEGKCYTDKVNWGSCSCDIGGELPMIPSPSVLWCSRVQPREELLKPSLASRLCVFAGIGLVRPVYMATCSQSPFARWVFGSDGTILHVGTGYCLTVLDWENASMVTGKQVGMEPCGILAPSQRFRVLSPKGKGGGLQLYAAPEFCVHNSFNIRPCKDKEQAWVRGNRPRCGTRKRRAACVSSVATMGCACRWVKGKCMS